MYKIVSGAMENAEIIKTFRENIKYLKKLWTDKEDNIFENPKNSLKSPSKISQMMAIHTKKGTRYMFVVAGSSKKSIHSGYGFMQYKEGFYVGEWKKGKKEGTGVFIWNKNGRKDVGKWKKDKKNGPETQHLKGTETSEGFTYVGKRENGKKVGVGCFTSENGERYKGKYKKGKRIGTWTQISKNGKTLYEDYWKNGKKKGEKYLI